jgi:hypothetical protein
MQNVFAQLPGVRDPFETKHRFYALVETQGAPGVLLWQSLRGG